jgi:hypothetical protein
MGTETYLNTTPEPQELVGNRLRRRYQKAQGRRRISRLKSDPLLTLTENFFYTCLQRTLGASAHPVRACRHALKLFFLFPANQKRKPVANLILEDVQADAVLAFRPRRITPWKVRRHAELPPRCPSQFCTASAAAGCASILQ